MKEGRGPRVVVLGGGSAGWITACLLQHEWAEWGGSVTVVESPAIGIIGVGEGSTPQLKAFFDHLGIAEDEWMPACDATWKLGIRFTGWSERPGFASYFHPFPGPIDLHTEPQFVQNCALARQGLEVPAHPDSWFLATKMAEARKAPHPPANFPFPPSYGYHFDAHKLGAFLRQWATTRGVEHRQFKVAKVQRTDTGDIEALVGEGGELLAGDIFVDCSGFRSMLAEQVMGARYISFAENLVNDRAVVVQTPHAGPYKPQTDAHAMSAGWRWSIPLTSRIGNGYVYSSRYISDEDAEAELRLALGGAEGEVRLLQMRVGRLENCWTGNCLAVGLAQGFIEPLEATALHLVIVTALEFAQCYRRGGFDNEQRNALNASIAARCEGIRDYIVGHYRLNKRTDTAYWRDAATNDTISTNLAQMMTAWFRKHDMSVANDTVYGGRRYYPNLSWHCLFAGYGNFPGHTGEYRERTEKSKPPQRFFESCLSNFPTL